MKAFVCPLILRHRTVVMMVAVPIERKTMTENILNLLAERIFPSCLPRKVSNAVAAISAVKVPTKTRTKS